MDEIRNLCINSSNLLAWIQTVVGGGTTAGNVFLGRRPANLPDAQVVGPTAVVFPEGLELDTTSEDSMYGTVDIVVDVKWFEDHRKAEERIVEMNFICGMLKEFVNDAGIALSSSAGGHLQRITVGDLVEESEGKRTAFHVPIVFNVSFGLD